MTCKNVILISALSYLLLTENLSYGWDFELHKLTINSSAPLFIATINTGITSNNVKVSTYKLVNTGKSLTFITTWWSLFVLQM